jgi:hypothetical protein
MPKGVGKRLDIYHARMVWQEKDGVRKHDLVNWLDVCQPRNQGGLGVNNPEIKNISLLCKWLWIFENGEGDWQEVIIAKYLNRKTLTRCEASSGNSHFRTGLRVLRIFFVLVV